MITGSTTCNPTISSPESLDMSYSDSCCRKNAAENAVFGATIVTAVVVTAAMIIAIQTKINEGVTASDMSYGNQRLASGGLFIVNLALPLSAFWRDRLSFVQAIVRWALETGIDCIMDYSTLSNIGSPRVTMTTPECLSRNK